MPAAEEKLQNEIKLVLEMTARVDERVKLVVEKQSEMTQRLNSFIDSHNALTSRVTVLEAKNGNVMHEVKNKVDSLVERVVKLESDPLPAQANRIEKSVSDARDDIDDLMENFHKVEKRVHMLEDGNAGMWAKTKYGLDLAIKAIWALALGYLLYKLGWTAPTTPH